MFEKNLLNNKRILVSGGGSGLGKAMATRYLELGADIYICGRRICATIIETYQNIDFIQQSMKTFVCNVFMGGVLGLTDD